MAIARDKFYQMLQYGMQSSYDLESVNDPSLAPLVLRATYHEHNTSYLLIKSAKMWTADRHEFMFVFDVPHLTLDVYEKAIQQMLALGEPLIQPDKQHMCTALVAVFLCDDAEPEAIQAVKKCRIKKSFKFSLQGWMEVQTAAVELGNETVAANFPNCETAKYLKNLLRGRRRRGFNTFLTNLKLKKGE